MSTLSNPAPSASGTGWGRSTGVPAEPEGAAGQKSPEADDQHGRDHREYAVLPRRAGHSVQNN